MSSLVARAWPWLAAALSGALLAGCFAPFDQGWLAWIALTPLICAVWFGRSRPLALGYVAGVIFFTTTFYWLGSLATLYANPWLHALPLVLALYMGLYFAFWAWFLGGVLVPRATGADFLRSRRNLALGALGACAWVAQEWVRGWMFSGFGWNTLGVALHADLPMIQIVDITGVAGLSWLVAFCNLMAVIIVRRLIAEFGPLFLKRIRWEFSATMALVVLVFGYGTRALLHQPAEATVPLRIVALQPNIPQLEKFDPAHEDDVFQTLEMLTGLAAATQRPELIIWPEASTPRGMFADDVNHQFVLSQAERGDFGLLIGTVDFDAATGGDYNVAVLLTARGQEQQLYRKMHLVPFGEYLPLRPIFAPFLGQLVPADFTPGRDFTLLELKTPPVRLAALVCFEDTLDELTRQFAARGANVLVNITNDGWFLRSAGAEQHLANSIFRAIENRRPLIRCTNTGMTCSVSRNGHIDRWLKPFQQGFAARELAVPQHPTSTFFTRHGDWISSACAAIVALQLAASLWRARCRK